MKKLLVLIPVIFSLMACVESELIVPGENVGEGNVDTDPSTPDVELLQTYEYNGSQGPYQFNFNDAGVLTSMDFDGYSNTLRYTSDMLTQFSYSQNGTFPQIGVGYNDDGNISELYSIDNPDDKLTITYEGNDITAIKSVDGSEDIDIEFTTDSSGYITGYSYTDPSNDNDYELNLTLSGNLVNSILIAENDDVLAQMDFEYDSNINPVFEQAIDLHNFFMLEKLFSYNSPSTIPLTQIYATIRSSNNITSVTTTSNTPSIQESIERIAYEYTDTGYPTSGTITEEGSDDTSPIGYTYY